MVTKKVLFVSIMTILCLFSILFMTFPTRSASEEYDPWADVSGPTIGEPDGTINMRDIQYEILHFNTYGTPVNRTALLEAQSQIENLTTLILELQSRMDSLNVTVIEQQNTINNLNQTVVYLNETVAILNSTGLGAPDYDSGWQPIPVAGGLTLTHNLNTTEVVVYVIGRYDDGGGGKSVHQRYYGGDSSIQGERGAFWTALYNTTITIYRGGNDDFQYKWEDVRVMIWKISEP